MPLVRIDLLRGRSPEERVAIGSVHQAMTETIDVPHDDVFQVITEHDEPGLRYHPGYLGIERDDGLRAHHAARRPERSAEAGAIRPCDGTARRAGWRGARLAYRTLSVGHSASPCRSYASNW